jgi:hypothetical protein
MRVLRLKCLFSVALLVPLLAAGVLHATTVVPMSVEELTAAADSVVEARALSSWSQWNPEHTIIFTYTQFQVIKTLKGSLPQQIVVKQPGGIVGAYGQRVPGVRQFQSGESTVLFLRPSAANDGSHVVVGLMQGNFRMYLAHNGERAVSNGVRGVSEFTDRSARVYTGSAMTLQSLESRVQGAQAK